MRESVDYKRKTHKKQYTVVDWFTYNDVVVLATSSFGTNSECDDHNSYQDDNQQSSNHSPNNATD